MKPLFNVFLAGLLVVGSAFAPVADSIYPELVQSFKQIKKSNPVSYERQDVLTGIQQMGIVAKGQKKPVLIELISNDGFSAPFAKAILKAALANNGINDVKVFTVGAAPSEKVTPALTRLGFKVGTDGGLNAKYNDQGGSVTFESSASNPQAVHVLLNEDASSLLSSPDKFAVKLKYPGLTGATDEQIQQQEKLIAAEMIFVANKIKDNWNY